MPIVIHCAGKLHSNNSQLPNCLSNIYAAQGTRIEFLCVLWQTTFQFFLEYEKCTSLCALWVTASNFSSSSPSTRPWTCVSVRGRSATKRTSRQKVARLLLSSLPSPAPLPSRSYCLLQKFFYSFVKRWSPAIIRWQNETNPCTARAPSPESALGAGFANFVLLCCCCWLCWHCT